ncbi:MAG: hypothetical protein P8170_09795 [Gemmatimonadota bacterium]
MRKPRDIRFTSPAGSPYVGAIMPAQPSLIERLKRARFVQVLVVYLGATWVVLQLVDTLVGLLSLPGWVGPVAVVLLGVGLVVVLATAWVQSLPSTTAAEEAGELPTDWQIAPADALASLRSGKLPHLTWGRAILGGAVALSLLFGATGVYLLTVGGRVLPGPAMAGAEPAANAVAVLPFEARGTELAVYEEGMVHLLTANLEGLGGLRTINSGTVVARWQSELGETTTAELDQALRVAGGLGARYAVRGSVVDAGGQVRLSADVFDLADGSRIDGVQVQGTSSGMLDLVDDLTVQLAQLFVGTRPGAATRARAVDTGSLDALEAYLRGEALFRELRFEDAIEVFREAVTVDTLFALAWWRLSEAYGWAETGADEGHEALRRAAALAADLPARERVLVRADTDLQEGSNASIPLLRSHLDRHPEDADAWSLLAEFAAHAPWLSMAPEEELESSLIRAVELMPSFSPYYIHLIGLMMADGRETEFQEYVRQATSVNPQDAYLVAWQPAWDFFWGDPEQIRAAATFLRSLPISQRAVAGMGTLQSDAAIRVHSALDVFPKGFFDQAYPYMSSAVATAAGIGPEGWEVQQAPGLVRWSLLVEDPEPALSELSTAVARGPTMAEAVSAAVLAAYAGNDGLREAALETLPDTAWAGPYGRFGGAASAAEARRTARAMSHLRNGEAGTAADLLGETLRQTSYDALAVYLMGQAQADLGASGEALRYWEVLLRSAFRPHVRLGMGRVHEAKGDTAAALESYRGFLTMWAEADPTLAPMVEAAEAVRRLGG